MGDIFRIVLMLLGIGASIALAIMTLSVIVWLFQVNVLVGIAGIVLCEVLAPTIVVVLIAHAVGVL